MFRFRISTASVWPTAIVTVPRRIPLVRASTAASTAPATSPMAAPATRAKGNGQWPLMLARPAA